MSGRCPPERILMLTDFFEPVIGGLELHVGMMSRELARRGHHVAVATLAHPDRPTWERHDGVSVHRVAGWSRALGRFYADASRPFHPTVADPGVACALKRIVAGERPTIVQCHSWIMHSYLSITARPRSKTLVYLHDYGTVCAKKTMVYGTEICDGPSLTRCVGCSVEHYGLVKGAALAAGLRASRRHYARVDRWAANSAAVADTTARGLGIAREQITVVPSFVQDNVSELAARSPRPSFLPAGDFILFVGALGSHKGLDVLLQAYAQLGRDVPLVAIGTPQADTPRSFPDGVQVFENVPHREVIAAWAHCLMGVVPSTWPEPFGQVAVEAMAACKPVVASNVGGLREIVVDGETGLLVPRNDADALASAIARLLDDPQLRQRLGQAGRERAKRYTLAAVADQVESIHAQLRSIA
ncbi:MAG: glycosyltransferase family 4 protein [Solirubrobacteraceae bacterium]|jgi:glycosyltransferase involved in cell wall biosynthesis